MSSKSIALIAAITLINAATAQECSFDSKDQAADFLKNVGDPDNWSEKPAETADEVQTATAEDDGANVVIKTDSLADAAATLETITPAADFPKSLIKSDGVDATQTAAE